MALYSYLPKAIKDFVFANEMDLSLTEIRLRSEMPVLLNVKGKMQVLENQVISQEDLEDIFLQMCHYSIPSYENDIANGFITLEDGHRVGIGGEFYYNPQSKKYLLKTLSSLNIRIAHHVKSFVNLDKLLMDMNKSILVVGAPHSGKTSLIKLYTQELLHHYTVTICDERNEIYSSCFNCDVIRGVKKPIAISMATRTLNPDFIICDEIGLKEESEEILSAVNTGVKFICSAHGSSITQVLCRPNIKILVDNQIFEKIILLEHKQGVFAIKECYDV